GLWAWRRLGVALKQPISDLLLGTTSWLGARRVFVPGCESSRLTSAVLLPGKRHLPGGPRRRRSANRNWRDRSAPDEADPIGVPERKEMALCNELCEAGRPGGFLPKHALTGLSARVLKSSDERIRGLRVEAEETSR